MQVRSRGIEGGETENLSLCAGTEHFVKVISSFLPAETVLSGIWGIHLENSRLPTQRQHSPINSSPFQKIYNKKEN